MMDNGNSISNMIRNRLFKENNKKGSNEAKQQSVRAPMTDKTNTQSNFHHTSTKSNVQPNKTPERSRPPITTSSTTYSSPGKVRPSTSSNRLLGSPPTNKMTSTPGEVVYDSPYKSKSRNNVPTTSPEAVKSTPGVHTSGVNRPGPLFSTFAKKGDIERPDWRNTAHLADRAVDRKDSDSSTIYSSEDLLMNSTNTSEIKKLSDMPKITSLPKAKNNNSGCAGLFSPQPTKVHFLSQYIRQIE
jgi:hypothetical protein